MTGKYLLVIAAASFAASFELEAMFGGGAAGAGGRRQHRHLVRAVRGSDNTTYLQKLDVVTIQTGDPKDDPKQLAQEQRFRRNCGKTESASCVFVNKADTVFFSMGLKFSPCSYPKPHKYRFRFSAKYPGTYIIRFKSSRGSYLAVIRTYKSKQVVNFAWPWHRVHVGHDLKAFLMIKPSTPSATFSPGMRWTVLDLQKILNGTVSTGDADFNLIFRSRNVAMVEQMMPFKITDHVKVGSCRFTGL